MIDREDQWWICIGTEGGPQCDGIGAHDILEGTNCNQVCHRDRPKQSLGKASSVNSGVGVRLQANR